MKKHIQKICQDRDVKIEELSRKLTRVKTEREQADLLQEIELVTGVKLVFD